ncbi:MAG: protein kinase domain-containing protein [Gemmatimonadales bacterium]
MTSILQEQVQRALGDAHLLERELGGGGMSRVFLAHERALGRKVVVKVLLPELAAGVNVERFRREIQLAAQLQHPHIVPLLSAGEADGLPYFIMPYVSGESLRARISREGEFPISGTLRILRDLVSALGYAHSHGVVHRDVKPENVLLSGGVAVVTDFGVAKAVTVSADAAGVSGLTSLGVALGTPTYMAPEQATGSPHTDHRADIYSLGVVAYEMLTGFPPFTGRSPQAMLAAHVVEEPEGIERRRPSVPPMLAALVKECLAKRPAERPQTADELIHVLDAIATPSGGTAATTAVRLPPHEGHSVRSRRGLIAASLAGLVLLLAGIVLWSGRPRVDSATTPPKPIETAPRIADSAPEPAATVKEVPTPPVVLPPPTARPTRRAPAPAVPPPHTPKPAEIPLVPETRTSSAPVVSLADSASQVAPVSPPPPVPVPESPPAAEAKPLAPPPPPEPERRPDARPAILGAIAAYARAIEMKSLPQLQSVYPGMTPLQQRGWEQFFQLVRDVKAELTAQQLGVRGDAADAQVTGTYVYLNTSTGRQERQPVSFRASFRKQGDTWRIVQVR